VYSTEYITIALIHTYPPNHNTKLQAYPSRFQDRIHLVLIEIKFNGNYIGDRIKMRIIIMIIQTGITENEADACVLDNDHYNQDQRSKSFS
jgi:hypothetical protein